jgi:hypothetical protein
MSIFFNNVIIEQEIQQTKNNDYSSLLERHPDKVLFYLIIDKNIDHSIPQKKFLVPKTYTFTYFIQKIRKFIHLRKDEGLFYLINNEVPLMSSNVNFIYYKYKNPNGLVYIIIFKETLFGKNIG